MNIIDIHVYGYGKLENYHISSLSGLQVFYGENEAGKSTVMSFIHSILFGFPGKHSSELRYEPKNHSKYGGKLKAFFPGKGIVVIERVKGRAAGDVTVSMQDGTIGGEELLKDLLGGIDKSIFQGIFSFNVHGLQNVQAMKGEDLGRYLFSAGTLGTDKLLQAEGVLQKEMEQRFKPSGKKPVLNEKLKELKEVKAALKNAEKQNEHYSQFQAEKDRINSRIGQLEGEIAKLEMETARLRDYKRNEHLVIEEARLIKRLEETGLFIFPEDGLSRLEKIGQQIKPIRARMLWIEDKRVSLLKEAEGCKPDFALLDMETEISARIEKQPIYEQLVQEKNLLDLKLEELLEEISQINDSLHTELTEEKIQDVNTSIFIKEKAENVQQRQQRLDEKKLELEAAFEEEKAALVELEKQAASFEKERLPEQKRIQLSRELDAAENHESIKSELNQVREQIAAYKAMVNNEQIRLKRQRKKDFYQLVLLGSIFLILVIWGFMNGQLLLSTTGAIGILAISAIYIKSSADSKKETRDEGTTRLLERERLLNEKLGRQPDGDLFTIKSLLQKDDELRQQHRELKVKIQQQNLRYEKVIQQFEKWEFEVSELRKDRKELIEKLGLRGSSSPKKVFDAYVLIEKQKQLFRERKRIADRLGAISETLAEIETSLSQLGRQFLQNPDLPPGETGTLLKKKIREAVADKARYRGLMAKLEELDEEYTILEKELQMLTNEKQDLFAQADAADEDQFRMYAQKNRQKKDWSSRLVDVGHQLEGAGITPEDKLAILNGEPLEDQLDKKAGLIDQYKKEQTDLLGQFAHVKHSMQLLEAGGIFSELLHKYRQLKHEFEEDAKEWAKYAVARDLLSKTIDRYKNERMPKMLAEAERFLAHLTEGNYIRVIPQDAGAGFFVERKDHLLFEANELSQATAEQVYVSIRLALAAIYFDRYPLPLIIDDSFVNFDHKRAARMMELLREFSGNQILIFTCHRHILDHFSESEILQLGKTRDKAIYE
ncbi:AAA family ATPase [Bacillus sp. REN3]|uniref:ATP-binding protein n=1 Tax=Bacillus sp. REN3 TaxID=2802440 RepID=UPI001AED3438|nr:AAA family ATPase [Bacillus sp. REN3]